MKRQSETKPISADGNRLFFRRLANWQAFAFRQRRFRYPRPTCCRTLTTWTRNRDSPTRRNTDQIALRTQWKGNDITVTAITACRDPDLFEDADVETSDQHPIFARYGYPARNAFKTYAVVV
jgi:hypothetical protein